jgi:EAL domain-containing protein (putative c-di-GMP-specific phosphodiesterase class I)
VPQRGLLTGGIDPKPARLDSGEAMGDVAATTERFQEVKELGVRIAIDDFGSGYAIHANLQSMPLDYLKVDRSSIAATDDKAYGSWLLQTIIVLGRDLSIPVIATEIEMYEELAALQAMGCSMAQGCSSADLPWPPPPRASCKASSRCHRPPPGACPTDPRPPGS